MKAKMEAVKQISKKKLYHSLSSKRCHLTNVNKTKEMKDRTKQLQEKPYTNVLSFILG